MLVAVPVVMIVDVDEGEVADAINELLRPITKEYCPHPTCLVDYSVRYGMPVAIAPENYQEGDAFIE